MTFPSQAHPASGLRDIGLSRAPRSPRLACANIIISITKHARLVALFAVSSAAHAGLPQCDLLLATTNPSANLRAITALDLVRLRDFGGMGFGRAPYPAAVSPAGDRIALQLRRADPETNSYCVGIVVKALGRAEPARIVADGGTIKRSSFDKYGITGLVSGAPTAATLRWSPDGRWIGFTRQTDGVTQVWRVQADGTAEEQITRSKVDILDFQWRGDGRAIIFSSRPGLIDARAAIDREAASGFRYDGRFWPLAANRPYPSSTVPRLIFSADVTTGDVRDASAGERELLDPSTSPDWPSGAVRMLRSPDGQASAWIAPERSGAYGQPARLHAAWRGRELPCPGADCQNVTDLWWVDPETLLYFKREGTADADTTLYRWTPVSGAPKRIVTTPDVWFGCQIAQRALLCAAEASTKPRHVVTIDPARGAVRTVYDPNPEFASIRLSRPRRLRWTNTYGLETFGDLVLPEGRAPHTKLPLIVVQYESRGFLRGGTADEYPIQLFAANGFAVLSFNRPPSIASLQPGRNLLNYIRANVSDGKDRRNILSSLEIGVQKLIDAGIVDPARIGITGQSDGATTAELALAHSRLFAAAALSTCCESPAMMATAGEGLSAEYQSYGYPSYSAPRADFWRFGALAPNVASLPKIPLLIQAADEEYKLALETFETVREAGWPTEMYVFPGEAHVKFQPAHRLAVYERNLQWFQRWLMPSARAATTKR